MKIENFNEVNSEFLHSIEGQDRFYNSLSSFVTLYEIPEWIKEHGYYDGVALKFYDIVTKNVYRPFEKQKNITYSLSKFQDDYFYFIQFDFNENILNLIKYYPEKTLETILTLSLNDVNLYNLFLEDGYTLHLASTNDKFTSYFPRKFELDLNSRQSVLYIDTDKIYISEWAEEGVSKDGITNNYKYYEYLLEVDYNGKILSKKLGTLSKLSDGKWYLS